MGSDASVPQEPRLEVGESDVGASRVPAFAVHAGEVVGLVVRRGTHEEWMRFFGERLRRDRASGGASSGRAAVLDPLALPRPAADGPLLDVLASRGLARDRAAEIVSAVGLRPEQAHASLQLTDRVLVELHVLLQRGVDLAVVATAGLDPPGIRRVLQEAFALRPRCSSIVVLHADVMRFHEPLERLARVLHVP